MPRVKVPLPQDEVEFLASLSGRSLRDRLRELYAAGWSLSVLAESCTPPLPRSTVHTWVSSSSSSPSDSSPIAAAENSPSSLPAPSPVPLPSASAAASPSTLPSTSPAAPQAPYPRTPRATAYDPRRPALDTYSAEKIAELAPIARRYRSGMASSSATAQANAELTFLCKDAHRRGASIRELSLAAGVTYKAMERRIKR